MFLILLVIVFCFIVGFSPKIKKYNKIQKIQKLLINKEYKILFREHYDEVKRTDLTDEELTFLAKYFYSSKKLTHSCSTLAYRTSLHYFKRDLYNGRRLNFQALHIIFQKLQYKDGSIVYLINTESHYGSPVWKNQKMSYPYQTIYDDHYVQKNDLEKIYHEIMNDKFTIEEEIPREEKMSRKLLNF